MEYIILIAVVVIFSILNNSYNSQSFNHIKVDEKQELKGDLRDHEAGILIALMAKVAKADGQVSDFEAQLLSHTFTDISMVFQNSEQIREELKNIYNDEKNIFENTIIISNKYYKLTKNSYNKRLQLIQYLLNMAFIDGDFSNAEQMIIEDISNAIKIRQNDLDNLINEFIQHNNNQKTNDAISLEKAYDILELSSNIDNKELKKQYRLLVKKYHPDIITGKGADESTIKEATIKLQNINEAYEIIKKHRGI